MKRFIYVCSIVYFIMTSTAVLADSWDDFSGVDRAWEGQKAITNKEFEEVVNALEENKNKKETKAKNKLIKKIGGGGTSLHNELNPNNNITELSPLKNNKDGLLLNIPVNIIVDESPLDKGFYKVIGERDKNNDIYLNFYQSQFFKGKVRACETNDDFDSEELDFVKLVPYNENFIKIIFGSMDFNAYAYIRFVE